MNQSLVDLLTRTFASGALQHPGDANSPARVIRLPASAPPACLKTKRTK